MLLTLVLLTAAPAPAASAAIVWGGGKTRADAERWAKSFTQAQPPFASLFTLKPGFPKIVESGKVKGMKAGFHVVLLGVCPAAELEPRMKVFKAMYAGAYARKVSGVEAACPELTAKVRVTHSDSVTGDDTTLTLSQLLTPKGEMLRATHLSRSGAFLGTEGFDTPRPTQSACLGGFRQVGEAFEVTLCESTKERNLCCQSPKLTTLNIVAGAMKAQAGAAPEPKPKPKPAPEAADAPDTRDCTTTAIGDGFVFEECVDGEISHGEGFTEREKSADLIVQRDGKELTRATIAHWSAGWEWGTTWTMIGTIAMDQGHKAAVLLREDYGEGDGLAAQSAAALVYGPELDLLWNADANALSVSVKDGVLKVKSQTYISGEPGEDGVAVEVVRRTWKDGAFVPP
jgi:hypothetical protein